MKTIRPERLSNTRLFVFWLIVFVLPLITARILVNLHANQLTQTEESDLRTALRQEMSLYLTDLELSSQIEKQIKKVERLLASELAASAKPYDAKNICGLSQRFFEETGIFMPALIAAYIPESRETEILRINTDSLNPGRKSLEIILTYLNDLTNNSNAENQARLYQQICRSAFGELLQPARQPGLLVSGFLSKGRGDRAFVYHNSIEIRRNGKKFILFAVFAEAETGLKELLNLARQQNSSPAITRSFAMMSTAADRDFFFDRHNNLSYAVPIPPAVLRTGSHAGKDWYSNIFATNKALEKPARLPFAVVTHQPETSRQKNVSGNDLANLLLLAFFFIGTALVHQIATLRFARAPINRKFALCIMLSTVLPFSVLIVSAYRYTRHFSLSMIQNRLHQMGNELYLIEANIHSHSQRKRFNIYTFLKRLQNSSHLSSTRLRQMLDDEFGRLYIGYMFFRNDATLIERLPDTRTASSDDRSKLLLMRDLTLAQFYDVFVHSSALARNFAENSAMIPDFKRWRAFSVHYNPIDRNSFSIQDGENFPVKISERQYIEYSTHNLFSNPSAKAVWAGLILLVDAHATAENYLNQLPGHTFTRTHGDSLTHTAIFRLNTQEQIDRQIAWPRNALSDNLMLQTAMSLASGKTESAWYSFDKTGAVNLFCARAVSDTPFVVVSRGELTVTNVIEAFLPVLLLLVIIYLLALTKLLSLILAESFIKPVNLMLDGLTALDKGFYPVVACDSANELGSLVGDFNDMVEGMRQRRILERFISDEVSQTVAESASDPDKLAGNLVHRAIMFIHIHNFDELCEKLEPESVIALLNIYFSKLEPAVTSQGGQIDKYIGDAIMVSFAGERCGGKPELAACMTSLQCRGKMPEIMARLAERGLPAIVIGTGIAAGTVILGKIGARNGRKDFTLIGDAVNLAARLESASRFDGRPHILISESVRTAAANIRCKPHARLKVKGKENAVEVFELEEIA